MRKDSKGCGDEQRESGALHLSLRSQLPSLREDLHPLAWRQGPFQGRGSGLAELGRIAVSG